MLPLKTIRLIGFFVAMMARMQLWGSIPPEILPIEDVPLKAVFLFSEEIKNPSTEALQKCLQLTEAYSDSCLTRKAILQLESYITDPSNSGSVISPVAYIEIGNLYFTQGLYKVAAGYYSKAIKNSRYKITFRYYPIALYNLGLCQKKQGRLKKAEKSFLAAGHFWMNFIKDSLNVPECLTQAGELSILKKNFSKGKHYLNRAFNLLSTLQNPKYEHKPEVNETACRILLDFALIYRETHHTGKAITCLEIAETYVKINPALYGYLIPPIAFQWIKTNMLKKAENCLLLFPDSRLTGKNIDTYLNYLNEKSDLLARTGQMDESEKVKLNALEIADSVYSRRNLIGILEHIGRSLLWQQQYLQNEQKQKLDLNNSILATRLEINRTFSYLMLIIAAGILFSYLFYLKSKRDGQIILAQSKEKQILIKEIHHRVKNNLSIVSGILDMQQRYVNKEDQKSIFKDARLRISSMALVHKNLFEQIDATGIDAESYFQNLFKTVNSAYKIRNLEISLFIKCNQIRLNVDTLIPLALLVNELLTNSFKFAFKGRENGEIHIEIKKTDGKFVLYYSDNGIGKPDNAKAGLGSNLVNGLSRQLNGQVKELSSHEGIFYKVTFSGINIQHEQSK